MKVVSLLTMFLLSRAAQGLLATHKLPIKGSFIGASMSFRHPTLFGSITEAKTRVFTLTSQRRKPAALSTVSMGLFGLGAPEIAVIVAVAAFVLGPQKLADLARDAGKGVGELKDVPAEFNEGFQEASTSSETKEIARQLGATMNSFKDTAADLAGEYKDVATEFGKGVREGAQGASRDLVSGLEVTNDLVSDVREGVQAVKTTINEAEVVESAPVDAPNRTDSV